MNPVEQAEIDIDVKADAQIGINRTEEEIARYLTQFLKVVPASGGEDVGGGIVVRGEDVEEVEKVVVGVKRNVEEETKPRKKRESRNGWVKVLLGRRQRRMLC